MTEANPFEAPKKTERPTNDGATSLSEMDFKQLKKLRNNSQTIGVLGVLWCLGAILNVVVGVMTLLSGKEDAGTGFVSIVIGALVGGAAYGAFTRPPWGKIVSIILCALALIGFPLGTAIGIIGLIALSGGQRLFGPGRLLHSDLEREYKARKKAKR